VELDLQFGANGGINMQNWRARGLSIIIFQISRASLEIFGPWVGFWKSVGLI
jgi:hypothetical protein